MPKWNGPQKPDAVVHTSISIFSCGYHFDLPPSILGLLHQNVCPVPGLLQNVKYPVTEPINDNVHGDRLSNTKIVATFFFALKLKAA